MTDDDAYRFWKRVDDLRGETQLRDICSKFGINYKTLLDMRTKERFPKIDTSIKLAESFGTTLDYLYTGKESKLYSEEARYVDNTPEAKTLVKVLMRDPALLSALSLVIESTKNTIDTGKGA